MFQKSKSCSIAAAISLAFSSNVERVQSEEPSAAAAPGPLVAAVTTRTDGVGSNQKRDLGVKEVWSTSRVLSPEKNLPGFIRVIKVLESGNLLCLGESKDGERWLLSGSILERTSGKILANLNIEASQVDGPETVMGCFESPSGGLVLCTRCYGNSGNDDLIKVRKINLSKSSMTEDSQVHTQLNLLKDIAFSGHQLTGTVKIQCDNKHLAVITGSGAVLLDIADFTRKFEIKNEFSENGIKGKFIALSDIETVCWAVDDSSPSLFIGRKSGKSEKLDIPIIEASAILDIMSVSSDKVGLVLNSKPDNTKYFITYSLGKSTWSKPIKLGQNQGRLSKFSLLNENQLVYLAEEGENKRLLSSDITTGETKEISVLNGSSGNNLFGAWPGSLAVVAAKNVASGNDVEIARVDSSGSSGILNVKLTSSSQFLFSSLNELLFAGIGSSGVLVGGNATDGSPTVNAYIIN